MNGKRYRTIEQDMELVRELRARVMQRYDLTEEQVIRHGLDEPMLDEAKRARLAAEVKQRAGVFERDAMQRFRRSIAERYGITTGQVIQGCLDRPLMQEEAREYLVSSIKQVQARRTENRMRKHPHGEHRVASLRPELQVLSA